MKLSAKKREELYAAIHNAVMDARLALLLPAAKDFRVAHIVNDAWDRVKKVLRMDEEGRG